MPAISFPSSWARATHSSIVTFETGMKGMTSVAPMRGCPPLCFSMSISSAALAQQANAACLTAWGSPTKVSTIRLWLESEE